MKMLKILAFSLVILALAAGPVLAAEPGPRPSARCWAAISTKKSMSMTRGSVSSSAAPAVPRNSKKTRKNT